MCSDVTVEMDGDVTETQESHGESRGNAAKDAASEPAISVKGISKCFRIYDKPQDRLWQGLWRGRKKLYREFWALNNVSIDIKKGETVGVIGRNGSGKSTLLQMICSTLTPTTGEVQINGRVAALLELGSGFDPEFSGRENIYMNASLLGLSKDEIDERYDAIVEFADIGEFIDQPVKTYSSGMFVRLGFAVVAHVDADILVIDEALAVGDAFFTQKCIRFLRRFRETGAILFVSHDTGAVVNLCHHAIWLDQGNVLATGNPKEVCESYLASFHETSNEVSKRSPAVQSSPKSKGKDQRLQIINQSKHRNDLELIAFDPDKPSFGKGCATIDNVKLLNEEGEPLSWIVGGETVTLSISGIATQNLDNLIVGFLVKDRLGQTLFGDNTFLTYVDQPVKVQTDQRIEAQFQFSIPILPVGDYSVCAAIAEGTQIEHVQHHWVHDALFIKSHTSSVCTGLVGVPMQSIALTVK